MDSNACKCSGSWADSSHAVAAVQLDEAQLNARCCFDAAPPASRSMAAANLRLSASLGGLQASFSQYSHRQSTCFMLACLRPL